jgi:putative DNA primase/helicase
MELDADFKRLLAHLHRDGLHLGYWWTDHQRRTTWWNSDAPAPVPVGHLNVYYGVHPVAKQPVHAYKSGAKAGQVKPPAETRPYISDICAVSALFAEFDAAQFGGKEQTLDHLFTLPPATVVIDSGGGYHAYWLLRETVHITTEQDTERMRDVQARWVQFTGGDEGAKDLARVLRVPGTKNYKPKYAPDYPTVTMLWYDDTLYTLDELEAYIPKPQAVNLSAPVPMAMPIAPPRVVTADQAVKRAAAYIGALPPSISGQHGHDAAYRAACECVRFDLSDADALSVLETAYNPRCSPPWSEDDLRYKVASARTNTPAAEVGMRLRGVRNADEREKGLDEFAPKSPHPNLPPLGEGTKPVQAAAKQAPLPVPIPAAHEERTYNDLELGDMWLSRYPDTKYGIGEFRRYSNGWWPVVELDTVRQEIRTVLEAANLKDPRVRPNSSRLNSVMELARVKIYTPSAMWDQNPDVLVCGNGTLHIPTRTLRPHHKQDYLTGGLSYAYDPDAKAPNLHRVLSAVPDAANFLQEFCGYALTIDTRHEIAVWLVGAMGSGKSTFVTAVETMLGARTGLLGLADIERSSFALTGLPGKTLMVSTEQPSEFMRATHVLNAIISGESLTVDRKFRDPVIIRPYAKLLWAMNALPRVPEAENGIFRRVKVVRFPAMPKKMRDPKVKENIKTEGAGILNWALDGLARLNERGYFVIPDSVTAATEAFEHNNDVAAVFVSDKCKVGGDLKTGSATLYNAYKDWCMSNGHKPKSSTAIAEDWARLGFEKKKTMMGMVWEGVELTEKLP